MVCALLVAPLFLVDVPPLLDYPNHLARLSVLAAPDDPYLSRFYAVHWQLLPNLAIDVLGPALMQVLPLHVAGRLLIGLAVLMLMGGMAAYSCAALGRRSWWVLAGALVVYHRMLLMGFLNFSVAAGLSFLLAAAWLRWRDPRPSVALAILVPGALLLLFTHILGIVFLGVLLAGAEFAWLWRRLRGEGLSLMDIARRVGAGVMVFVLPAAVYVTSPLAREKGQFDWATPAAKLRGLMTPFTGYDLTMDAVTVMVVVLVVGMLLRSRRGWMAAPAAWSLVLFVIGFALAPDGAKGSFYMDQRMLIPAGCLLFAGLMPRPLPRGGDIIIASVLGLLVLVRVGVLAMAWHGHAATLESFRRTIAPVPPGAVVYFGTVAAPGPNTPGDVLSNGTRTDTHMAGLVVAERRAWWPFLFDFASQQPVITRPPFSTIAEGLGGVPEYADPVLPATTNLCGFDYALMQTAGGARDLSGFGAGRLAPVVVEPRFALFRVDPARCAG